MRPPGLNIRITCWTVVSRLAFLTEMPAVPVEWFVGGICKFKMLDMMFSFERQMKLPIPSY
jgi:hypothetical protein